MVAVTGRATEFTKACTFGWGVDGAGNTIALAIENSFCSAAESVCDVEERGAAKIVPGDPPAVAVVLAELNVRMEETDGTVTGAGSEASRTPCTEETLTV